MTRTDPRSRVVVVTLTPLLALTLWAGSAPAYETITTHPGLTARAALASTLHRHLVRSHGEPLGLLAPLRLHPGAMTPRRHRLLWRHLRHLDPAGGYRPDVERGQRGLGWIMAGSVLEQMPASRNRHHFYSPVRRGGLDDRAPLMAWTTGLLAVVEGSDSVRQFLTGAGFDLTGTSALDWVRSADNPLSLDAYHDHVSLAVQSATPRERRHHLAMSLLAMGALLHVLQDMASPTHVRNDFRVGHMQRLGKSTLFRASAYERYVARTYKQLGLPPPGGKPVRRPTLDAYFSASDWQGLADLTSLGHFSPGTVPPPVQVLRRSDPRELRKRLAKRLPLSEPRLGPIDLRCALRRTCYMKRGGQPMLAYRITSARQLEFFLDERCHAAAARRLLPLAQRYSTGLIDHLLRGAVEPQIEPAEGDEPPRFTVRNTGARLASGTARLLWEDGTGRRQPAGAHAIVAAPRGGELLAVSVEPPADARKLVVIVDGKDQRGERVLATGFVELRQDGEASSDDSE